MFHACFMMIDSWKDRKNVRAGIVLNKNLLGSGYRKQKTIHRPNKSVRLERENA